MAAEHDDIQIPNPDAGLMFRAEMFVMNVLLGYAKVLIGLVVVVLLTVLVIGQYRGYHQQRQRAASAEMAQIEGDLRKRILADLPEQEREAALRYDIDATRLLALFPMTDASRTAASEAAAALDATAEGVSGPARVEASLRAAELHRIAGASAARRASLERAAGEADGALLYAAVGGLADLDLADGNTDAGIERLRGMAALFDGFLAEQTQLDLGIALEQAGRPDEAALVYADFVATHPNSPRIEEATSRNERLGTH